MWFYLINIESAIIDLLGGTDVLQYQGVAGSDENIEVHASATAAKGVLRIVDELDIVFENTDIIDLVANIGDADTVAFTGTDEADELTVDLAAAGTTAEPVLQLHDADSGGLLLTLRDYAGFGTLGVHGADGADQFNVHVAPAGPGAGRNLSIDGGAPSGKGASKDAIDLFFQTPPNPDIDHDEDNKNNLGAFSVEYELHEFLITYSDIERALVKAGAAG